MSHRSLSLPTGQTSPLLRAALVLSGAFGASGVVLLAWAAHGDTSGLATTAAQMMLFHAPVILALGAISQMRRSFLLTLALVLLTLGLVLFCGDLISRTFTGDRLFPMAAPTGGTLTIAGWVAMVLCAFRLQAR